MTTCDYKFEDTSYQASEDLIQFAIELDKRTLTEDPVIYSSSEAIEYIRLLRAEQNNNTSNIIS